jgi:hypothetical protein
MQVHGWFSLKDVRHRLPELPPPKLQVVYGPKNNTQYGKVASIPKHVVLAMTDKGTHGFLHDNKRIRRCMWDGEVSVADKVAIASKMLAWLRPMKPIEHHVYNYEDGNVLLMAKLYMALDEEE